MRKFILGLVIVFSAFVVKAQDTLTFLQYNLLNYGNFTSYCTSGNNNVSLKTGYVGLIVHYVKPDIFTVNEMTVNSYYHNYLLDNGLNTDGVNYYAMASDTLKNNYQYTMSVLYYNKNKLGEAGHFVAQTDIRDVDIFKMYYKSANLSQGDTTFIYCVVGHLKAGTGEENENKRAIMAENTMAYIATHHPNENYLLMGDFNVYSSSEPAFQAFINYKDTSIRFHDPVNEVGDWHNNPVYAKVQTQSTHTSTSGCPSGGGLDDRFDFILLSTNVKNGTKGVKYVPNSFHVVGQDGKHFNEALTDPPENKSVPANILNALYKNSDHLPVTLKVTVNKPLGVPQIHSDIDQLSFANPVNNTLDLKIDAARQTKLTMEVFSLVGQKVMQKEFMVSQGFSRQAIDVSHLQKGLYILRFTEPDGYNLSRKLLKY